MTISDDNQKKDEAIRQLAFDFKSLGYWVATRSELLPGVLAVKVVNGSMVVLAADYLSSDAGSDCLSKICRYFRSGFDGVLIATPNDEVKDRILIEIGKWIPETVRRNVAVVVIGQKQKERRTDEADS